MCPSASNVNLCKPCLDSLSFAICVYASFSSAVRRLSSARLSLCLLFGITYHPKKVINPIKINILANLK